MTIVIEAHEDGTIATNGQMAGGFPAHASLMR
jgi:hypothetical protein